MSTSVITLDFGLACPICGNRGDFFASKSAWLRQYLPKRGGDLRLRTISEDTDLYVCQCGNTNLREVNEEFLESHALTMRAFFELPNEDVVKLLA